MTKHKITMHMHQAAILQAAPQPPPDVLVPALRAKIHEAKKNSERAELKAALGQAKARPVSAVYPQISQAIYKNVNDALAGRVSPADAIKKASSQIDSALSTF